MLAGMEKIKNNKRYSKITPIEIFKLIHPPEFPSREGCRGGLSYRATLAHLIIIPTHKPA